MSVLRIFGLRRQTEGGRRALGTLRETFITVGNTFSEAWSGIKAAVGSGDLELAFKIAGSMALKEGAQKAGPILLEPMMRVGGCRAG
ncbi:MAG: hypothetical protein HC777_00455 [Hyphomonadaceae bacterium]|nr:hypothetical protein [Hyphomonadaceae bacterium]